MQLGSEALEGERKVEHLPHLCPALPMPFSQTVSQALMAMDMSPGYFSLENSGILAAFLFSCLQKQSKH